MVQFWLLFTELWHFDQNGAHHFSLIGRHLESVSRTELVFELNPESVVSIERAHSAIFAL